MSDKAAFTTDELASLLRDKVGEVANVDVCGTVARVFKAPSGHTYFELVGDGGARVNCVAWAQARVDAAAGKARVHVRKIDYYAPQGKCQAVVDAFALDAPAATATTGARRGPTPDESIWLVTCWLIANSAIGGASIAAIAAWTGLELPTMARRAACASCSASGRARIGSKLSQSATRGGGAAAAPASASACRRAQVRRASISSA